MSFLDFKLSLGDPGVWMRDVVKADGSEHFENFILYADDDLVVSENAKKVLRN